LHSNFKELDGKTDMGTSNCYSSWMFGE